MDVSATNEVEFEKVDKAIDLENWLFFKKVLRYQPTKVGLSKFWTFLKSHGYCHRRSQDF